MPAAAPSSPICNRTTPWCPRPSREHHLGLRPATPNLVLAYSEFAIITTSSSAGTDRGRGACRSVADHAPSQVMTVGWSDQAQRPTTSSECSGSSCAPGVPPLGPVSPPASGSIIPVSDTSSSGRPWEASIRIASIATCGSRNLKEISMDRGQFHRRGRALCPVPRSPRCPDWRPMG